MSPGAAMSIKQVVFCLVAHWLIGHGITANVNVTIPLSPPDVAPVVSPSLISLSIEQDRWTDWSGTASRNQFLYNTLNNLKSITGSAPHVRIGADSEDHTNFNPNGKYAQAVFPDPTSTVPYPEALSIVVGNAYYETAQFLPSDTHVIWGVNFGSNNITAAVLEAKSIITAFKSSAIKNAGITLDYLEIGNEPDLYKSNGLRPSNYTPAQYVKEWVTFATNISKTVGLTPGSGTQFVAGSIAGSSHDTTNFSPQSIFAAGLLQSTPGPLIASFSEHHYSGSFCSGSGGLLQNLMTKATIRSNISMYAPDADLVHAQGLDYILGETNSYSCHGAPGVSNTAGAALWALDYSLYATQIGISRLFFHDGIGYKYNLIQPVSLNRSTLDASPLPAPLSPHIQPQYYAAIIAAEALGNTGSSQVAELTVQNTGIAGYAIYENGNVARAVLINSQAFLTGDTNRTSTTINILFDSTGAKPTTMTVKRLSIGHADDVSGVTWGGQTYETTDGTVSGALKEDTVSVEEGVSITETEVVMLSFL